MNWLARNWSWFRSACLYSMTSVYILATETDIFIIINKFQTRRNIYVDCNCQKKKLNVNVFVRTTPKLLECDNSWVSWSLLKIKSHERWMRPSFQSDTVMWINHKMCISQLFCVCYSCVVVWLFFFSLFLSRCVWKFTCTFSVSWEVYNLQNTCIRLTKW